MTWLLFKLLEGMDVAKLGVVDVTESPLAELVAEGGLVVERAFSSTGVVALGVSRLIGRFSFCILRISRRITFQEQREK